MSDQPASTPQHAPPPPPAPASGIGTDAWTITPKQVAALLARDVGGFLLIDCRTKDEWEVGHVKGAVHVPMLDLGQHMDMLRDHEEQMIVVMCRSGQRSNTVATVLRAEGFPNVKFMAGGVMRWISDVDSGVNA